MQFNSYVFILLFLPIAISGYFVLGKFSKDRFTKVWLIAMSLCFYAYMNVKVLLILFGSMIVNYGVVWCLEQQKSNKRKKIFLGSGICFNIGILFLYKYFNFFAGNINTVFKSELPTLNLLLPLGISFITFQQISFLVDCYKETGTKSSFVEYAVYISFFPKISSGPIVLYREFIPQLKNMGTPKPNYDNISRGLYQFAHGLAKKVLIADTLAKVVAVGFNDIGGLHTFSALIVMLCYSLQLYYDFSGYSDMAVGVARMLNFELPVNFNSPYKAHSVSAFWKRWHITLTGFFTQYVYIPLGGNRKGIRRTCINTMIVFGLSGLWHGANWTFILWGCLHGLCLVIEKVTNRKIEKMPILGWMFTFLFVNVAWVIFRADTLQEAGVFLSKIFCWGTGTAEVALANVMNELVEVSILSRLGLWRIIGIMPTFILISFVAIVLLATLFGKNTQEKVESFSYSKRQMLITVILLFWSIISLTGVSTFLYSNF